MTAALGDLERTRAWLDADPSSIRIRVDAECFPMANPRAGGTIYQWTLGFHASPHQVARKFGHDDVLRLLDERSPIEVRLIDACWTEDARAARAIHDLDPAIVERLSAAERRLVADAARNNQRGTVQLMLECGWPVDAKGQHQATPLHWAAFHGNAGMAEAILGFAPTLEAIDADFKGTPLGWAIHGSVHGWHAQSGDYAGTVDALLRAGARLPGAVDGSPAVRDVLSRHLSGPG
jgi:hypothetical protein